MFMKKRLVPQYDQLPNEATFLRYIEEKLGSPIAITSYGPTAETKLFLDAWQKAID